MTRVSGFKNPQTPELEELRQGTRVQYESDWTLIIAGESAEFLHSLEDIPIATSVLRSELITGDYPQEATDLGTWVELTGTVVWDPGSIDDNEGETSSGITVTGAAFGDYVDVAAPYDLQGMTATAYVQATNTVEIQVDKNNQGPAVDLAEGTWTVRIQRYTAPEVTIALADSSATSGSGTTTLTVTNNMSSNAYFKVRAT